MHKRKKKQTIKDLAEKKGITYTDLGATFTPIKDKSTISRWNTKSRRVAFSDANHLAKTFGVDINDLDII
ncbi:helix-turn-helix domain-containing protein [Desulfoluna spongiiphila]|uniref:HTH cro/C1-type domain-containing protein n=1 Tax=Desulfoluna spongiiphila TaxID=419481 RepID=A0A1G5G139_9BACT|nr:helix-turn-helix transcriptional regulator [Desulfoluna spongiiphila]SCY45079.1 hypothetical protein SAMN05216233_109129 [Desulfoluna spongiiphila]